MNQNQDNAVLAQDLGITEAEVTELVQAEPVTDAPAVVAMEGEVLPPEPAAPVINIPEGASISYAELGQNRAREIAALDEKVAASRSTLRDDLLKVIAGPVESHGTYLAGFTAEMAEREKRQLNVATLRNVKSQVSRVLKAFKANPVSVKAALEDKGKRWEVIVKALPKASNAGRPATAPAQPAAGEGAAQPAALETATDAGGMLQSLEMVAKRLQSVSKGKKAWFAEFVACEVLETLISARDDFQRIYAAHFEGGIVKDEAKLREALRLDRKYS